MRSGRMDPPRRLSWGFAGSEDSWSKDQDGHGFRPPRSAFPRPSGTHPSASPTTEVTGWPSLPLRAPSETSRPSPARAVLSVWFPRPGSRRARCLSWVLVPYDTCRTQGFLIVDGGPLHHQGHVRGLATPLAAVPPASSRRRSVGASLGFALQGVPLARDGYSSRSPCPPDVAGCHPLREEGVHRGRLQGLVPAASPCCRPPAEAGGPSMPSWDFPLQSVPPIRPGTRL